MLLFYLAVALFCRRNWRIGCAIYSLAVSIKMNILLCAPGLLLLLLQGNSLSETILCLATCGFIQLALGLPFLTTYPIQYLRGAFDLGRVFMFKWTVNWKFLPPAVFVSKGLAAGLLAATLVTWGVFFFCHRAKTRVRVGKLRESIMDEGVERATCSVHELWRQGQCDVAKPEGAPDGLGNGPVKGRCWVDMDAGPELMAKHSEAYRQPARRGTQVDLNQPAHALPQEAVRSSRVLAERCFSLLANVNRRPLPDSMLERAIAMATAGRDPNSPAPRHERDAMALVVRCCSKEFEKARHDVTHQLRLLTPRHIVFTLFLSNFIGIAFARSLHYQFYCWYFHQLPFLVWETMLPLPGKLAILGLIELAFNVFPATWWSSSALQVAHGALLVSLFFAPAVMPCENKTRGVGEEEPETTHKKLS